MLKTFMIFPASILVGFLIACAAPALPEGMVPTTFDIQTRHRGSVTIVVWSSHETSNLVSNGAFSRALVQAIRKSGVFAKVVNHENAEYRLSITVHRLQQPVMGLNVQSSMEAVWTLSTIATGHAIWRKPIETEFTATVGDALFATERSRLAIEGTIKANIRQGIADLSRLDF